jgi:hypothetical protein
MQTEPPPLSACTRGARRHSSPAFLVAIGIRRVKEGGSDRRPSSAARREEGRHQPVDVEERHDEVGHVLRPELVGVADVADRCDEVVVRERDALGPRTGTAVSCLHGPYEGFIMVWYSTQGFIMVSPQASGRAVR